MLSRSSSIKWQPMKTKVWGDWCVHFANSFESKPWGYKSSALFSLPRLTSLTLWSESTSLQRWWWSLGTVVFNFGLFRSAFRHCSHLQTPTVAHTHPVALFGSWHSRTPLYTQLGGHLHTTLELTDLLPQYCFKDKEKLSVFFFFFLNTA